MELKLVAVTPSRRVELTDLLWVCDEVTGGRSPVDREAMVARLKASGQRRGARIAQSLPSHGGFLDEQAVDALMLRSTANFSALAKSCNCPDAWPRH